MSTMHLCTGVVKACDEIEARSHDGPIVDGRSARQFAPQNSGDVTLWDFDLSLALWFRYGFILDDPPSRVHTNGVHT
eukprot:6181158-Pleurochrysis_carterae.AAC.1